MAIFDLFRPKVHKPDLQYAAKGYVQVMVTRRYAPHVDLNALELGYAEELLLEGCSHEQALSARWGGVYAIHDDPSQFNQALGAFKDTLREQKGRSNFADTKEAREGYEAAAMLVLGTVCALHPKEYGRFLAYINA